MQISTDSQDLQIQNYKESKSLHPMPSWPRDFKMFVTQQ